MTSRDASHRRWHSRANVIMGTRRPRSSHSTCAWTCARAREGVLQVNQRRPSCSASTLLRALLQTPSYTCMSITATLAAPHYNDFSSKRVLSCDLQAADVQSTYVAPGAGAALYNIHATTREPTASRMCDCDGCSCSTIPLATGIYPWWEIERRMRTHTKAGGERKEEERDGASVSSRLRLACWLKGWRRDK